MSAMRYRSSNPDRWTQPRPHRDASLRYHMHGPIQPMELEERGILRRLFRLGRTARTATES
jgi:hypothetical protein